MTQSSSVILLVDDDENDVFFLKKALKQAGIRQSIHVLNDGEAAIDYLAGTAPFEDREKYPLPCLVLLDIKMPRKSGLEVLEWLRNLPQFKDLPVAMATSSGQKADREAANRLGVQAFLVKPVAWQDLLSLTRRLPFKEDPACQVSAAPEVAPQCSPPPTPTRTKDF